MEIKIKKKICKRCGHEWYPKPTPLGEVKEPIVCPKCKSPYWNKEKQNSQYKGEKMKKKKENY